MASNVKASIVLFLSLNIFLLVSSHDVKYNSNGSPSPTNTGNPVVIPPGYVLPKGNNTQGKSGTCNPLNLGVCLNLLGLVDVDLGDVPTQPCCSVIEGLVDLEAAVCLCTAVRANVLGININLPVSLNVLLNNCGRKVTTEYICGSDNMDSNSNVSSSTTNPTNPLDNNSNGSYSTTNPTNPVDNNSNDSSSTNPTNPVDNYSNVSSSTNPTNPVDNYPNDSSSSNPTNPVNNYPNGSSSPTNPTNPVDNYSSGPSSTNSPTPVDNYSNGSSSPTNTENPVVLPPGYVLPNGNNTHGKSGTCNPLNLGVCVNLLGLVDVELGNVPTKPCCSLIEGLVDLEAAVCLCTAVRANVLGININLPISLNLLLNNCGRRVATEYICSA